MTKQFIFGSFLLLTLTHFQVTLTWDQCDLCNPDLKDMLDNLREQIDKIEEQFFSCCPECPAGYRAVSGHCYHLSQEQLPWQTAMDSCVMQGARLVAIDNKDKQEALLKYVQKKIGNDQEKLTYYTSGNSASGKWAWGQGQEAKPMTYSSWINPMRDRIPSDKGKCLEWRVGHGWNSVPCSTFRYYICEHISDTDITQNDYTDYMAAAKMNVEYLQGQGLASDDRQEGQGQSQEYYRGQGQNKEFSKGQGQPEEYSSSQDVETQRKASHTKKQADANQQMVTPVRTTAETPDGTTQLTPRTPITRSYRSQQL